MELIESVAGDDSLRFDSPEQITVKPVGSQKTWATIETKTPDSLKVTLAGPPEAIDEDELPSLRIDRPVSRGKQTKITFNLTESETPSQPKTQIVPQTSPCRFSTMTPAKLIAKKL